MGSSALSNYITLIMVVILKIVADLKFGHCFHLKIIDHRGNSALSIIIKQSSSISDKIAWEKVTGSPRWDLGQDRISLV